ncbi:hypothetical protein PVL29_000481 [Vitis rotundifolia]|uniref:Transmembrane protein n=1 Tax=Vitis rotundifolia TaxID=103349 RepID=A0AA39AK10_VITRO|nr:hypothetical protein PVL29_000481 [Vitis rotundifolia]
MDERPVTLEPLVNGEDDVTNAHSNHGWQKVTYAKRNRKQQSKNSDSVGNSEKVRANGTLATGDKPNVFRSLEQQAEERRRRVLEAQMVAAAAADDLQVRSKSKHRSDDEDDDSDGEVAAENGQVQEKKVKKPKVKKPKVTVADAASKIDAADLAAFLVDVSASYESKEGIQLMRFADYFGRAFSAVNSSQFPWMKMFRESTVAKIADVPLCHISDVVYKTSVDWINQRTSEALGSFVLWSLDGILSDLASQQAVTKGSKKGLQHASSKSQACQGDLAVGLYLWAHNILPIVNGKSTCNPQSRDLVLQLVERILSAPKARTILVNGAIRKGERLVPPSAFEILMRATFPASSARIKATERFEAVYPTLKEVALAGPAGSKAMKQASQQTLTFTIKAAGESIPELSNEASSIFIWCLTQNPDCYKQWDRIYLDNLEASVAILRKLTEQLKELSLKQSSLDPLRETLKSFRHKNEKELAGGGDAAHQALLKDSDKYCKGILGRVSRGHGCMKSLTFAVIAAVAVGAALMSPNMESWDLKKLSVVFSSSPSF